MGAFAYKENPWKM